MLLKKPYQAAGLVETNSRNVDMAGKRLYYYTFNTIPGDNTVWGIGYMKMRNAYK